MLNEDELMDLVGMNDDMRQIAEVQYAKIMQEANKQFNKMDDLVIKLNQFITQGN